MKNTLWSLIILALLLGLFYFVFWNKPANIEPKILNCREGQIGEKTFILERSFTDEARQKGLSGKLSLVPYGGMIFEFENKAIYGFWMKDMYFPIDIIFVDDEFVTDIHKSADPKDFPKTYENTMPANFVIELASGESEKTKIQVGEKIKIFPPKECNF